MSCAFCRLSEPHLPIVLIGASLFTYQALPAQGRSLDEIRQSGEIRICLVASHDESTNNWAKPEGCRDDCDEFHGYYVDTTNAFLDTLGDDIEAKLIRISWDEQFHNEDGETVREASYTPELLASGTCDLYPNVLYELDWRQTKLDFVGLASFRDMIMVHEDQQDEIQELADLAGRRTAFGAGLAGKEWFEEQNETILADDPVEIVDVEGSEEVIDLFERREIDFMYMYPELALGPRGQQIADMVTAFPIGTVYTGSWAFRKGDDDLRDSVQTFVDEQKPDTGSALNEAWQKTFAMTLPEWDAMMVE